MSTYRLVKLENDTTNQDMVCSDLHAQIQRCRERIKENIMPHVYEYKLEGLLEDQKERELVSLAT